MLFPKLVIFQVKWEENGLDFLYIFFQSSKENNVKDGPFLEMIKETSDVREHTALFRKKKEKKRIVSSLWAAL